MIHKSTAAYASQNHWSMDWNIHELWPNGHTYSNHYTGSKSYQHGAEVIDYEEGPRYLRIGAGKYCNWKRCEHTSGLSIVGNTFNCANSYRSPYGPVLYEARAYNIPWLQYSTWDYTTAPGIPPIGGAVTAAMDRLYADIAGRAQSYLLSLEDVAGFFSGNSIVKSIRSVAQATDKLATAVAISRRLIRRFGWRSSFHDCWSKSKDLVQRIVGLRLGYRFSFKTTLNDVAEAVLWSGQYAQYLRSITERNDHDYLRYEKAEHVDTSSIQNWSGSETNGILMRNHPYRDRLTYFANASSAPQSWRIRSAGHSVLAFARAKVRYPTDYKTFRHYFEGRAGLDKPLTTLWAIVPMSFVVDYLLNVQDSLTVLDNRLNDYLVSMSILQPWVGHSAFRRVEIATGAFPSSGRLAYDPNYNWNLSIPALSCRVTVSEQYERAPVVGAAVSSQFPPIIGGDSNWIQHVGTGLELLVSR